MTMTEEIDEVKTLPDIIRLVGTGHRNNTVSIYEFEIDDFTVPYTEITKWPCYSETDHTQVYRADFRWNKQHDDGKVETFIGPRWFGGGAVEPFEKEFEPFYIWTITLDDRLAYDFTSFEELLRVGPILANGMAIAAGFTCHGTSFHRNIHGPAYTIG